MMRSRSLTRLDFLFRKTSLALPLALFYACGAQELPDADPAPDAKAEYHLQSCPAPALTPKWEGKAATAGWPSPTAGQLVYDAGRGRLVALDPTPGSDKPGATWEFDGSAFVQVAAPEKSPPARSSFAMAYDSLRKRVVVFGGTRTSGYYLDDTWEWDGVTWTKMMPAGATPPRRWGGQMAFDKGRGKMVLFGGGNGAGLIADTWEYDGSQWKQVMVTGTAPPRTSHAIAYDEAHARVVIYGGYGAGSRRLTDTWEYDGTTWRQNLGAGAMQAVAGVVAAYDQRRGRIIAFGGDYYLMTGSSYQSNNTYEYDGTSWQQVNIPGTKPPERTGAMMAYDSRRSRIVLYGGYYGYDRTLWEHYIYEEPNRAPVLDYQLGDRTIFAEDTDSFTVKATDPDANPLTYSMTGLPVGATLDPGSGAFRFTPTPAQAGKYTVTITASDGCLAAKKTITITVLYVSYAALPTGSVDMRAHYFAVPSYFEQCDRRGCARSSYDSHMECQLVGKNPGKVVATCTLSPYTGSVWLPDRPTGSAPIGPDQRFAIAATPYTTIGGYIEPRGADGYLVISSFETRWNNTLKTASTASGSQLLAPFP